MLGVGGGGGQIGGEGGKGKGGRGKTFQGLTVMDAVLTWQLTLVTDRPPPHPPTSQPDYPMSQ